MDTKITTRQITLDKSLNRMKCCPKLELLTKHEICILAARPGGATDDDKTMTWKDIKECVTHTNKLNTLLTAKKSETSKQAEAR